MLMVLAVALCAGRREAEQILVPHVDADTVGDGSHLVEVVDPVVPAAGLAGKFFQKARAVRLLWRSLAGVAVEDADRVHLQVGFEHL